ncbi:hypothetical protein CDAR_76691 [Caerostris darwini]|uniref:Uncharacterized protein n=1 Tax=Caerostris darwini TaxID=1538125 RepID=A0AAV4QCL0_9ARAC|nr:hypothetical protein CDAR_76691 [Caerostris darwini]
MPYKEKIIKTTTDGIKSKLNHFASRASIDSKLREEQIWVIPTDTIALPKTLSHKNRKEGQKERKEHPSGTTASTASPDCRRERERQGRQKADES